MIENDYLGMELEIDSCQVEINNQVNNGQRPITDENQIKSKVIDIIVIEGRKVLLTLDTRSGQGINQDVINTNVELVFVHEDFPIENLNDIFPKFVPQLVSFISKFDIKKYIKNSTIVLYTYDNQKEQLKDGELFNVKNVLSNLPGEDSNLMIHITCACPLANIKFDRIEEFNILDFNTLTPSQKNFIYLVHKMIKGANSDGLSDPKANMEVMNRTSFGGIFSRLENKARIINCLDKLFEFEKNNIITPTVGNVENFLAFLESVNEVISLPTTIYRPIFDNDPTYLANKSECLGISKLGYTFGHNDEWPIWEFRGAGTYKISQLQSYMEKVVERLELRSTNQINFFVDSFRLQ